MDASWKASEWLQLAHEFIKDKTAGPSWDQWVTIWFTFEGTFSADDVVLSRLPECKSRPEALSGWLLTRDYVHPLEISDPTAFGLEWLVWWNALQPAWRRSCTCGNLPVTLDLEHPSSHNIQSLHKGSPNRLVMVLISLKCWHLASGNGDLWMQAVDDLTSCFMDVAVLIPAKPSNSR
ncbi:hypothetical protein L208DRAFT_1340024 [Tricholoma matsutake]|nr:hypothetical protein L208DRAFT_1340024 [Tricholoma matsutake 945]